MCIGKDNVGILPFTLVPAQKGEGIPAPEARDLSLARFGLGLAKLRLDGFASLDAGHERRGIFIARPLISDGTQLVINARCRGEGSIAAEIVDVNDDVIPGFSNVECDVFSGDSVRHTFSWRGQTQIPVSPLKELSTPGRNVNVFAKSVSTCKMRSFILFVWSSRIDGIKNLMR